MLKDRNPTMIYGLLLLLSNLAQHATAMLISLDPTTTTNASNHIESHCYNPDTSPTMGETNLKDCRDTLLKIARTPDFTTRITFSKNPRRGVSLPRGWKSGECLIFFSCENDRDAYTFRYADVLASAREIVDLCVGTTVTEQYGLMRWGGIYILGDSDTFYVSVGRPLNPRTSAGNLIPVGLVNETLLNPMNEIA